MAASPDALAPFLVLEGSDVLIQEDPGVGLEGVMKVRVPFLRGGSVSKAPGFRKKIYFPTTLTPSVVQEGQRKIAERKQPLTSFARHAHATSGADLPVGAVTELEQDGRDGYAIIEISPTDGPNGGKNIQTLIRNKHLNAVSLRSGEGNFQLESKLVNGEEMLQVKSLRLDGIDFAPNSPAQSTYGMEILQEEPSIDEPPIPPTRRKSAVSELTLEALRTENPSLIAEIEAPHKAALSKVEQERDALLAEKRSAAREAKLREIAAQFPKPEEALPLLLEECRDCDTDDQVAAKAFPILLEAMKGIQQTRTSPRQELLKQFTTSGKSKQALTQENQGDELEVEDLPRGAKVAAV